VGTITSGILGRRIDETPMAVIDFETTGLSPGYDRVVEVSVVRIDPGSRPRLVLDSLVNPGRRVAATEIHGITDRHVVDAPLFDDLAGDLLHALSDSVVVAHNVYFDLKFLRFELDRLGLFQDVPHVCTMYSRPLLELKACSLNEACLVDRIDYTPAHTSRSDSMAAALLWMQYRDAFRERRIFTFRDLTLTKKKYKFFSSFGFSTLRHGRMVGSRPSALKPRV
jgi:DNA polymerase-3 subunit epsilon